MTQPKLRDYQVTGVEFLQQVGRAGLFDEAGIGKTPQALCASEGRTLIVASPLLLDQWFEERTIWAPDLDLTGVSYHSLNLRERTDRGGNRVLDVPKLQYAGHYDTVILDEIHNIKERTTTWTKAIQKLDYDRLYLLSGTPIPNWAHELYIPLKMLHPPKDKQFSSYWRWIRTWFQTWNPQWGGVQIQNLLACDRSCDKIKPYCHHWTDFQIGNHLDQLTIRRERDDVLTELPEVQRQLLWLDMTSQQRKVYKQLKKDFVVWLEETDDQIVTMSQGALATKLYKLTTGISTELEEWPLSGSCKLQALDSKLIERKGQPTVIFTYFRNTAIASAKLAVRHSPTSLIHGGVPQAERARTLADWKAGKTDTLIGTLATIREGLNLQRADYCIFVEHSPRPSDNDQAVNRLNRLGQTRPVTVLDLATRDSMDEYLRKKLSKKRVHQVAAIPKSEWVNLV